MEDNLPTPVFPKTRLQIAAEYNMNIQAFRRRLKHEGIHLPGGLVMPSDQVRIYRALGAPPFVWTSDGLIPFQS